MCVFVCVCKREIQTETETEKIKQFENDIERSQ